MLDCIVAAACGLTDSLQKMSQTLGQPLVTRSTSSRLTGRRGSVGYNTEGAKVMCCELSARWT
jgi:hypothetical protein